MNNQQFTFSKEAQHSLLGHVIQNQRTFDVLQHLELAKTPSGQDNSKGLLHDPNDNRIFNSLVRFANKHHRIPTLNELKGGELAVDEKPIVMACMKAIDRALEYSKSIAIDTFFDDLISMKMGQVLAEGLQHSADTYNKKDIEGTVNKVQELARTLEHIKSNGLTAMTKLSSEWYDLSFERQEATPARLLYTGLSFIDEALYGLAPDDLMILTTYTGFGKSQIMMLMAYNIAESGKKVKLFSLEAGKTEVELRIRYWKMLENYYKTERGVVDYAAWKRGLLPELKKFELDQNIIKKVLKNISITYKQSSQYTVEQLERDVMECAKEMDVILIDHLHYIDKGTKQSETEALSAIVRRIRDINLAIDRPVVLAAHIKKSQEARRFKTLLPSTDDIYGSGDISKTATIILTLAQTGDLDPTQMPTDDLREYGYPTLARYLKCRDHGASRTSFTLVPFFTRGSYAKHYTIGQTSKSDTIWNAIGEYKIPPWAKSCFEFKPKPKSDQPLKIEQNKPKELKAAS